MARGRPLKPLEVSRSTREELESLVRSRSVPAGLVSRAEIVLLCADGLDNKGVAEKVRTSRQTVGKWRERFRTQGLMGLYDERRPGKPRSIEDDEVMLLLQKTLETEPLDGSTQWSCRSMADTTGLSKSTVHRVWTAFNIQPHRQKHFKLSTDPFFVEKIHDIVGLYLNPPDNALVLCVDEKRQTQAFELTQPLLPLGLGYVEGVTHGYIRHSITTLFAALDVATGQILTQCKPRHRHQELLSFLKHIDANVPPDLDVHLIVDNYSPHKHAKVKRWIAARPRYHIHFTHLFVPARPGRDLVQHHHPKGHPLRLFLLSPPTHGQDPILSAPPITQMPVPSCGPPQLIPSSTRSRDCVQLSLGQETSGRPACTPSTGQSS